MFIVLLYATFALSLPLCEFHSNVVSEAIKNCKRNISEIVLVGRLQAGILAKKP